MKYKVKLKKFNMASLGTKNTKITEKYSFMSRHEIDMKYEGDSTLGFYRFCKPPVE
jgi:hypothetical protein